MKIVSVIILTLLVCFCVNLSFAAEPVDLRGKRGVVDPNDLKKYDPKPPKVQQVVPPPPKQEVSQSKTSTNERADAYRALGAEVRSAGPLSRVGAQAVTMDNIKKQKEK